MSNWYFNISSHASLQAFGDPGKQKTYFPDTTAARALDWIVEVPILLKLICLKSSPKPSINLSEIFIVISLF